MADDDWESEFLSTRHVHNRGTRGRGTKGGGGFDVKNTFGSYDLECKAAEHLRTTDDAAAREETNKRPEGRRRRKQKAKRDTDGSRMNILRLTDDGKGLLGELVLPGVLEAGIVLSATKKGLEEFKTEIRDEGSKKETSDSFPESQSTTKTRVDREAGSESTSGTDNEDSATSTLSEDKEKRRFDTFEKNSFRQPKFWVWWKGAVQGVASSTDSEPREKHSGMGYVVFSGNSCRRFTGTLSCAVLEWKDVSISGWKN